MTEVTRVCLREGGIVPEESEKLAMSVIMWEMDDRQALMRVVGGGLR